MALRIHDTRIRLQWIICHAALTLCAWISCAQFASGMVNSTSTRQDAQPISAAGFVQEPTSLSAAFGNLDVYVLDQRGNILTSGWCLGCFALNGEDIDWSIAYQVLPVDHGSGLAQFNGLLPGRYLVVAFGSASDPGAPLVAEVLPGERRCLELLVTTPERSLYARIRTKPPGSHLDGHLAARHADGSISYLTPDRGGVAGQDWICRLLPSGAAELFSPTNAVHIPNEAVLRAGKLYDLEVKSTSVLQVRADDSVRSLDLPLHVRIVPREPPRVPAWNGRLDSMSQTLHLHALLPGEYIAQVAADSGVRYELPLSLLPNTPSLLEISLVPELALSVRVACSLDFSAYCGARILLLPASLQDWVQGAIWEDLYQYQRDAVASGVMSVHGELLIPNVPIGAYVLAMELPSGYAWTEHIEHNRLGVHTLCAPALAPVYLRILGDCDCASVYCRIVKANGDPEPAARLGDEFPIEFRLGVLPDRLTVPTLYLHPGDYSLSIRKTPTSPPIDAVLEIHSIPFSVTWPMGALVSVETGSLPTAEIRLSTEIAYSGKARSSAWKWLQLEMIDEAQQVVGVTAAALSPPGVEGRTGLVFPRSLRVAPGRYRIRLGGPGWRVSSPRHVHLRPCEVATVEAPVLPELCAQTVKLLYHTGLPVANSGVLAWYRMQSELSDYGLFSPCYLRTDDNGRFYVLGPVGAALCVRVLPSGVQPHESIVEQWAKYIERPDAEITLVASKDELILTVDGSK